MRAHLDAIGNVCGRYEGERPGLPCLMLGSHYDTVRDAGKWDGPLGLITAISCVADLHRRGKRLPFADRGDRVCRRGGRPLRFHAARQPRGRRHLQRERARCAGRGRHLDARGAANSSASIPIISARRRAGARELLAYVELHIEQGPVLEDQDLPVGVVTAIAGATRLAAQPHRHGRPCRHGADGAAARCAGGRRRMHRRDRGFLPHRRKTAWSAPSDISTRCPAPPMSSRGRCPSPSTSARRPTCTASSRLPISFGRSKPSPNAASCRCSSTSPMRTAPCPARPGSRARSPKPSRRKAIACSNCRAARGMTAWR